MYITAVIDLTIRVCNNRDYSNKRLNYVHLVWRSDAQLYWMVHKNAPNFAMMLYCSAIEFEKERTFFKSSHSWTVWEIMTLYAFVLAVKYAEVHKITKVQHVWLHEIDIQSQRLAENVQNPASIQFSNRIQSFSVVQWIFELSQWWPPSICFWLPLWGLVYLQTEVVGLCTPNPAGIPNAVI